MDRPIDKEKHYYSPGGFEFTFASGETIAFDFNETESLIDENDPTIIHTRMKDLDYDSFPDAKKLDELIRTQKVTKINECYIYTGEECEPDINPVEIKACEFVIGEDDFSNKIEKTVLNKYTF